MASILKIGDKWRALIRRKGHKPQCKTFPVKAQAEAWARKIEADMDRGSVQADPGSYTVDDVIRAYRDLRDAGRPISDASNEHYMLKRISEGLGSMLAGSLRPQTLADYCKARKEEGAGPYTVNMEISRLGTILRYASISLNTTFPGVVSQARPLLSHTGLIGGGGKRERRPTEDEIQAIVKELQQPYSDVVLFAIHTAMRRGEIVRIRWADVDHGKRMVLVRDRKDPRKKIGNDQWVPLLGDAWKVLKRQPEGELIFPVHPQTISKYFHEACVRLGIPDLHFHDLRHEGTSRLFEEGYEVQQVALVTGHKSWNQLRRYTQLKPEDLHDHGKRQDAPPRPGSQRTVSRRQGKS